MQICTVQRENLAAYNSKKEKKSYVRELKFGMLCLVYKCVCVHKSNTIVTDPIKVFK